jgi:16S rRNA (cytosine1402-N4)-methyltransferase
MQIERGWVNWDFRAMLTAYGRVTITPKPLIMSNYSEAEHEPVMLRESLELLQSSAGDVVVDGTVGLGGHAAAILDRIGPDGLLIALDRDRESLEIARLRLEKQSRRVRFFHDNFKNLPLVLNRLGIPEVSGVLVDLGVSSYQLLTPERGFTFQGGGMLDMRMDQTQRLTAANLVNELPEEQLANIIYRYGEERMSRRIAAAIVAERRNGAITRSARLAEIVSRAVKGRIPPRIHPATRTFQALRISVNHELEGLGEFFQEILPFVKVGGRIVAISFHSLEDRIVKTSFRRLAGQCVCERAPELCTCPREARVRVVTPRPLTPSAAELAANPRSRSARLRAIEPIQPKGKEDAAQPTGGVSL